jgi:hypothetical protein
MAAKKKKKMGRPKNFQFPVRFGVRISKRTMNTLEREAKVKNLTPSTLARRLIDEGLSRLAADAVPQNVH